MFALASHRATPTAAGFCLEGGRSAFSVPMRRDAARMLRPGPGSCARDVASMPAAGPRRFAGASARRLILASACRSVAPAPAWSRRWPSIPDIATGAMGIAVLTSAASRENSQVFHWFFALRHAIFQCFYWFFA